MKKMELAVNTLVFAEQLNQGVPQEKFLAPLAELEITKVEIRREFIKDFKAEPEAIAEKAKLHNMEIYYSVPGFLYDKGNLLVDDLTGYFTEAKAMNAERIKLCIGDYREVRKEDVIKVNQLCDKYNLLLTVENDQTPDNGRVDKIIQFLEVGKTLGSRIQATFDIGNWIWQKEDPITNAKLLKQYVAYIHLKDVKGGAKPQVVLLDEGDIDWRTVIKELPKVPLALEYPCGTTYQKEILALEIKKTADYLTY